VRKKKKQLLLLLLDTPIPKTTRIKIAVLSTNKKKRSHTTTTTTATTKSSSSRYHTHPTQRTSTIGAEMDFATNLAPKRDLQNKTKPRNCAAAGGVIPICGPLGGGGLVGFRFFFLFFSIL
jgi:hypothetical protein